MSRRARVAGGLALSALLAATAASAQPEPSAAQQAFARGSDLFQAGDYEGALAAFLQSRALERRASNSINAALCLEKLGRDDEALEMYEEVLRSFGAQLGATQAALVQAIRGLGQKVGSVQIRASVDGQVLIDDRARWRLPLVGPAWVRKGRHRLRIVKEGYAAFEMDIDVTPGASIRVDARLVQLPGVALLRVEDATSEGADVIVDGRRVGAVPWEGVVAPGKHLVWTQQEDRGSAPAAITAVAGQTTLTRMASSALGPPAHLDAAPSDAVIAVDGTALGAGSWEGRLPVGLHEVSASLAGYRSESRPLMVPPSGAEEAPRLHLALAIDPSYRPPSPQAPPDPPSFLKGHPFIGGFGGFAYSPTLHAQLSPCKSACDPSASGAILGVRAGYRLGFGLAFEFSGGYMAVRSPLSFVSGFFPGVGISYRVQPARWLGLVARVTAGLPGAQTGNDVKVVPSNPGFVMPEVGGELSFGGLRVSLGLGMGFFPSSAPTVDLSDYSKLTPYRAFLLWAPQVGVVYSLE